MAALTLTWNISFEKECAKFVVISLLTDLFSLDSLQHPSHSSSAIFPSFQLSRRLSKQAKKCFSLSDKKVFVRAGQIMQCWTSRQLTQVLLHQRSSWAVCSTQTQTPSQLCQRGEWVYFFANGQLQSRHSPFFQHRSRVLVSSNEGGVGHQMKRRNEKKL